MADRSRRGIGVVVHGGVSPPEVVSVGFVAPGVGHRTPFVGRERELGALFGQAAGVPGVVTLVAGEAGVGKTRLLAEFAEESRSRGRRILWGRSPEGEGVPPFWPWVQLIRAWIEATETDAATVREIVGNGAPELVQLVPALGHFLPGTPEPVPLEPAQARFRLFDSVTSLFRRAARREPLTLILDDLHWSDPPSLRLLQFFAAELAGEPVRVCGAYREDEISTEHPLAGTIAALHRMAGFTTIRLSGLGPDAVADVVEALLPPDQRAEHTALAGVFYRNSGGNPFYVEQLVRHHLELPPGDDRLAVDGASEVPASVRAVISRRLDRLTSATRRCLDVAAVIGNECAVGSLSAVLERTHERVVANLDEAGRAGLVVAGARPSRFSFAHDLVRETIYAALPPGQRERLHRRVAEYLEREHEANPSAAGEVAQHYLLAGRGALARAVKWTTLAADGARASHAYEDAGRFYERLLRLVDVDPGFPAAARADILLDQAEAHHAAGNREAARRSSLAAAADARRLPANEGAHRLARAALAFGRDIDVMGVTDRVLIGLLEEADGRLAEESSVLRARVLARLGEALRFTEPGRGLDCARRGVALARATGDAPALLFCLCALRYLIGDPDRRDERLALSADVVALADEAGDRESALLGYRWRVADLVGAGDVAAADAALAVYERRATELRQPYYRWWGAVLRAMRAWFHGPAAEVERAAAAARELGRAAQQPDADPFYLFQMMLPLLERGQFGVLVEPLRRAADRYSVYRASLAWVYAEMGRGDEARDELRRLADGDFATVPVDGNWIVTMSMLSMVCAIVEDRAVARRLYERFRPFARYPIVTSNGMICAGAAGRTVGLAAAVAGELERAWDHFEEAILDDRRLSHAVEVVYTQRDYARMLLRYGGEREADRAAALLNEVIVAADAMGLDRSATAARELLAQADARRRPAPVSPAAPGTRPAAAVLAPPDDAEPRRLGRNGAGGARLSGRELEVLRRIAAGETNREIAAHLGLSPDTIRRHTHNIYTKLDARGRAEAVAQAIGRRLLDAHGV